MNRPAYFLAAALLTAAGFAQAQTSQAQTPQAQTPQAQTAMTRLHATLDKLDGDTLQATTEGGSKITVMLSDTTRIGGMEAARLSDITPDSYVGSAAMMQPDGTLRAMEVHIFPPAMRGAGDGSRPFGDDPQASMTNGAVGQVTGTSSRTITVTYKGGEKTIEVPPDTPIVMIEPGARSMLVPGAHITVFATKAADGTLAARNVTVGLHGLVPPV